MSLTNKTAAAISENTDLLTQSKERSRAAEKARLEARDEAIRQAELAKQEAIAAKQNELASIRQHEAEVPKTGQIQQGTKEERGIFAGFSHNHRPVYVMNNVPNFVPAYTPAEQAQLNALFDQEVQKQSELDKLLGTDTASTLRAPVFPVEDKRYSGGNVTVDYAATIALAQETGVHLPVSSGLAPTFQKDLQKQFEKLDTRKHYFLELNEGTPATPAEKITQVETTKPVTPQNPRPHILTGQPESKYANPDYVKPKTEKDMTELAGEQQKDTKHVLLNLTEGGKQPTNYFIGLTEGGQTQKVTKFADLTTQQRTQIQDIHLANKKQRTDLKASILELKNSGVKFITVKSGDTVKTVPIEDAYRQISKKGVTGIGVVQPIPEGFTVAGSLQNPIFISEGKQFVGPIKPEQQDYAKNISNLFGIPDISAATKPLEKYYNEPGRVTSNKTPVNTRDVSGLINSGTENKKPIEEKAKDFFEGVGTGLLRTSLIVTNAAPEAFMEIAKTGDPFAGEAVLKKHEAELERIGVGPSVVPSIETGKPTGRSPFYNVGELTGEILPVIVGLKNVFKNPSAKAKPEPIGKKAEIPQTQAPKTETLTQKIIQRPLTTKTENILRQKVNEINKLVNQDKANPITGIFKNVKEPAVSDVGVVKGARIPFKVSTVIEDLEATAKRTTSKKAEPIEEDFTYRPKAPMKQLESTNPNVIKNAKVDESLFGKPVNPLKDVFKNAKNIVAETEGKPSIADITRNIETREKYPKLFEKKAFERSAEDAEQRRIKNYFTPSEKYRYPNLNQDFYKGIPRIGSKRGDSFGGTGKTTKRPPTPPPDKPKTEGREVKTSGGQTLIQKIEVLTKKPKRLLSKTEKYNQDFRNGIPKIPVRKQIKKKVNGEAVIAGTLAAAPLPLVTATEEKDQTATNSTATNGTPNNGTGVLETQPISILEPKSITESRPGLVQKTAAITTPVHSVRPVFTYAKIQDMFSTPKTITQVKPKPIQTYKPATRLQYKPETDQIFKLVQPQATRLKQPFPQPEVSIFKTPQTTSTKLKQPEPLKLKQPEPQKTTFKEPPPANFGFSRGRESRTRRAKDLKPNAFVGNVSDVDIALGFNRKELTLGIKTSERRYKKDTQFAYKQGGFTKLVTQKNRSILSKKQRSILEREKPKEVKKKKRKTGGFF